MSKLKILIQNKFHHCRLVWDTKKDADAWQYLSQVMKPFILVKSELQKQVFGAGYPSLPTMTLDEFYDQEMKRNVKEQERQQNQPK